MNMNASTLHPSSMIFLAKRAACRPSGFTAVEMLVVIAIVAILGTIAMPSFANFSVNQRLRMATHDLVADLIYTRGEAIKRNNRVTITRVGQAGPGDGPSRTSTATPCAGTPRSPAP